jgi:ubiquinone/menaquinone biosynthesis C-methylase UbiE
MTLPNYAMNQQSFPEMYEQWLVGPLFRPFVEAIILDLQLSPGECVLDIACGTGIVARVAKERVGERGRVVGVDISADMLSVARKVGAGIEFREGNAASLPLKDGETFDVVVCHQGFQFFPDKSGAAAEMRRALKQGGKLAVATWRSDEETPFLHELRRIAERLLGPIADQRYNFAQAALKSFVHDAGFNNIEVETITRSVHFDDGGQFVRLNSMALVGLSAAGKQMNQEQRQQVVDSIIAESSSVLKLFSKGTAVDFDLRTNVAIARGQPTTSQTLP